MFKVGDKVLIKGFYTPKIIDGVKQTKDIFIVKEILSKDRVYVASDKGYFGELNPSELVKYDFIHPILSAVQDFFMEKISLMRKYSLKRVRQMRIYAQKRLIYLEKHPYCRYCGKPATDVHHTRGRVGDMLLDERYWESVCRKCHEKRRPQYYGNNDQNSPYAG